MRIFVKGDTWNIKSDDLQSVMFDRNKSQKWINISCEHTKITLRI